MEVIVSYDRRKAALNHQQLMQPRWQGRRLRRRPPRKQRPAAAAAAPEMTSKKSPSIAFQRSVLPQSQLYLLAGRMTCCPVVGAACRHWAVASGAARHVLHLLGLPSCAQSTEVNLYMLTNRMAMIDVSFLVAILIYSYMSKLSSCMKERLFIELSWCSYFTWLARACLSEPLCRWSCICL